MILFMVFVFGAGVGVVLALLAWALLLIGDDHGPAEWTPPPAAMRDHDK